MSADLGFSWVDRGTGEVQLRRSGAVVTVLRGARAAEFLAEVGGLDDDGAQQLMARWTGNYRRGNERTAREHPRNRAR